MYDYLYTRGSSMSYFESSAETLGNLQATPGEPPGNHSRPRLGSSITDIGIFNI